MSHNIDSEIEVEVLFFAAAAETVGLHRLQVSVRAGVSLGDLSKQLQGRYPGLSRWMHCGRWAVDEKFSELTTAIENPCTIAFIPPVSGG